MTASWILEVIAGCIAVIVPGFLFSLALFPEMSGRFVRAASSLGLGLLLSTWICYILARHHQLILMSFLKAMGIAGGVLLVLAYFRGALPRIGLKRETEAGRDVQVQAGDSCQG